jgi:hypothetical protein
VVANNAFEGPVNENVFYLPALSKLDMSNNRLLGTLPASVG